MTVVIPDEIVRATNLSESELKRELAVRLFERERLTLGQACRLAGMNLLDFQRLLGAERVPLHYDVVEFAQDLETIREISKP